MNLEFNDEQIALRDTVRSFLGREGSIAGHVRHCRRRRQVTTEGSGAGSRNMGTTGMLVPPNTDGCRPTIGRGGIVLEELGAGLHPGPWLFQAVAATTHWCDGVDSATAAPLFTGDADGSITARWGPADGVHTERGSNSATALRCPGRERGVWDAPPLT